MKNILCFIVPCYNEEAAIENTFICLKKKLSQLIDSGKISGESKILFVDDGSSDGTWALLSKFYEENSSVCAVKLSNNTGHQNALIAGLSEANRFADFTVSIDADLQDDLEAVDSFVNKYLEGFDVVYGVRKGRSTDSFFKRFTAETFYKLFRFLGAKAVFNHADFRLMSKRATEAVLQCREVNLVLRGIVPFVGFRSAVVEYERRIRQQGETKYTFTKMFSLAVNAITSFSTAPLYLLLYAGVLSSLLSLVGLIVYLIMFRGNYDIMWFILISVWICFGMIMTGIGILGVYLGKTYEEAKGRPRYFVESRLFK